MWRVVIAGLCYLNELRHFKCTEGCTMFGHPPSLCDGNLGQSAYVMSGGHVDQSEAGMMM